jgi:hypothetical protein
LGDVQNFATTGVAANQASVAVQAVLCWSEFYNGKWQPTKTSDINRPTTIAAAGSNAAKVFDGDRHLWRIEPQADGDALALKIYSALDGVPHPEIFFSIVISQSSGFYLYNTHSLPVRLEDLPGFQPSWIYQWPHSVTEYTGGRATGPSSTFGLDYWSSPWNRTFENQLVSSSIVTRYVGAQLASGWYSPFFFEDRRSVFYVTTTEAWVTVRDVTVFGILSASPSLQAKVADIPPLVTKQPPKRPDPGDPLLTIGTSGAVEMQSYVGGSATIRTALGSGITVLYQGRLIGAGSSAAATTAQTTAVQGSA